MTRGTVFLLPFLLALGGGLPAQFEGIWGPEFNHDVSSSTFPQGGSTYWPSPPQQPTTVFHAVHMAVIPKGPHRGKVLVWDMANLGHTSFWIQRWALVDPENQQFWNFSLRIPGNDGNLGCAGHAWMHDGRLLVAGGENMAQATGHKLAYIYDPPSAVATYGTWTKLPNNMARARWYATVTLLQSTRLGVWGGSNTVTTAPPLSDNAFNTYEVWDNLAGKWHQILQVRVWLGPRDILNKNQESPWSASPLGTYPQMFQLSELAYNTLIPPAYSFPLGRAFLVGNDPQCASVDHATNPGKWDDAPQPYKLPGASSSHDVPAVLLPGATDVVMHIGGYDGTFGALTTVQYIDNKLPNPAWTAMASLNIGRHQTNAVILPDASVLVMQGNAGPGGNYPNPLEVPLLNLELYKNGTWYLEQKDAESSPRTAHFTAVLLPSGRVLIAGGDSRTADYQVYSPWYLAGSPPRPTWSAANPPPNSFTYNQEFTLYHDPLPPGVEIGKVVLIAPGSVTHHREMHQRYVELETIASGSATEVVVKAPKNPTYAPKGYYMMWLVTTGGVPSVASWVELR